MNGIVPALQEAFHHDGWNRASLVGSRWINTARTGSLRGLRPMRSGIVASHRIAAEAKSSKQNVPVHKMCGRVVGNVVNRSERDNNVATASALLNF